MYGYVIYICTILCNAFTFNWNFTPSTRCFSQSTCLLWAFGRYLFYCLLPSPFSCLHSCILLLYPSSISIPNTENTESWPSRLRNSSVGWSWFSGGGSDLTSAPLSQLGFRTASRSGALSSFSPWCPEIAGHPPFLDKATNYIILIKYNYIIYYTHTILGISHENPSISPGLEDFLLIPQFHLTRFTRSPLFTTFWSPRSSTSTSSPSAACPCAAPHGPWTSSPWFGTTWRSANSCRAFECAKGVINRATMPWFLTGENPWPLMYSLCACNYIHS